MLGRVRPVSAFPAKVAAARAAAGLSRRTRAGGGTTLPGKLLLRMAPDAIERMARRLGEGSVVISATNGKTTTAKMLAALLAPERLLCRNTAGANLSSGVASALLACPGADLGVFEVDEAALPGVAHSLRPRVTVLGNLFRDQLDRYGELEAIAARWQQMAAELPADLAARQKRRRPAARVARACRPHAHLRHRLPRVGARGDAARERLEMVPRVWHPARVFARLSRPSRRVELPELRPAAAAPRRDGDGARAAGPRGHPLRAPDTHRLGPGAAADARPLQRLQRAHRGGGGLRRSAEPTSAASPPASSGSMPPSGGSSGFVWAIATPSCSWPRTRPVPTS